MPLFWWGLCRLLKKKNEISFVPLLFITGMRYYVWLIFLLDFHFNSLCLFHVIWVLGFFLKRLSLKLFLFKISRIEFQNRKNCSTLQLDNIESFLNYTKMQRITSVNKKCCTCEYLLLVYLSRLWNYLINNHMLYVKLVISSMFKKVH